MNKSWQGEGQIREARFGNTTTTQGPRRGGAIEILNDDLENADECEEDFNDHHEEEHGHCNRYEEDDDDHYYTREKTIDRNKSIIRASRALTLLTFLC